MRYYFFDKNDNERIYNDFDLAIQEAKEDGTTFKIRDTQGGEYHI